jgi:hypothetical protein
MPEHEAFLKGCEVVDFFSSRDHGRFYPSWPIRNWLSRQAAKRFKYIVHMDSDAFPVRDDWIDRYCSQITPECPIVAVNRLEFGVDYTHTCFLVFSAEGFRRHRFDFSRVGVIDAGAGIADYLREEGLRWKPLLRSNAHNYHPLVSGIYDDRIYHHSAGSRRPSSHYRHGPPAEEKTFDTKRQERRYRRGLKRKSKFLHYFLMKQVFNNTDSFIKQLRGIERPLDVEKEIRRLSPDYIKWIIDTRL